MEESVRDRSVGYVKVRLLRNSQKDTTESECLS